MALTRHPPRLTPSDQGTGQVEISCRITITSKDHDMDKISKAVHVLDESIDVIRVSLCTVELACLLTMIFFAFSCQSIERQTTTQATIKPSSMETRNPREVISASPVSWIGIEYLGGEERTERRGKESGGWGNRVMEGSGPPQL
ncbi:hypothetical protein EVAR_27252_1 [Eumeta japonica]|uniref:Uncharacterized protein n=1 Tax=Eumeta variegata TaxID=151549 RepID=A0A4C1W2K4_EUMVA|nr:hypothetical protein EVAR_27252_1 [Eumeta japonica]